MLGQDCSIETGQVYLPVYACHLTRSPHFIISPGLFNHKLSESLAVWNQLEMFCHL